MKNKNSQEPRNDFSALRNKIFFRTAIMLFFAVLIVFCIYVFSLKGYFADTVVRLLERFIYYGDYNLALETYHRYVRGNAAILVMAAVFAVFLVVLRIYLRSFTKYFNEINKGIDALVQESSDDVVFSPELSTVERKIYEIKKTLERRKVEAEIAEKRKNDLVMYLAHDLKTPLSSVIGYLTLLKDEQQISDELRERYLSISLEKAERLEDLINEFFEITRFNLSEITLQYSRINLTRLLEQLSFEFQPMLKEKDLTCELQAAEDIMLRCDANKIQRVFDNLLRNAVLYSYPNTKIGITAEKQDEQIVIRFKNHGDTIPAEKLSRIFEQFYRLDAARSSRGGAGLGLAIARQIVEQHGGMIDAVSADDTVEFTVTLPLS